MGERAAAAPLEVPRKRQIEIFSAGCHTCRTGVDLVRQIASDVDEVKELDMQDQNVVQLAKSLGVRKVPAVVITASRLARCCSGGAGPEETVLRAEGIGQSTPKIV